MTLREPSRRPKTLMNWLNPAPMTRPEPLAHEVPTVCHPVCRYQTKAPSVRTP